jgi:hypothetical protein
MLSALAAIPARNFCFERISLKNTRRGVGGGQVRTWVSFSAEKPVALGSVLGGNQQGFLPLWLKGASWAP